MKLSVLKQDYMEKARQLFKTGFFHIFGSNSINQVVRFAYSILIVRVIPKSNFGIFNAANNIFVLILLLSGLSIDSSVLQLSSEQQDNTERTHDLMQYGYRFGLSFNAVLSMVVLLIALFVPLPVQGSSLLLGLMVLLPLLDIIKRLQIIYLRVTLQNRAYAEANTLDTIAVSVLTILCAKLWWEKGIVWAQYMSLLFISVYMWLKLKVPFISKRPSLSAVDRHDLWKLSLITTLNNSLGSLLSMLGATILSFAVPDENLIADYRVASIIPYALDFIPLSLMTYAYPYFARHKDDLPWVRSKYSLLLRGCGLFNLLVTIGGIVLARPIFSIIFSSQYLDAVTPFRILMVSFFISGTFRILAGNLLVTQRRLQFNLLNGILGAVVSILCNVLLIPKFKSNGAALSQLISMSVTGMLGTGYFLYVIRSRSKEA